MFRWKSENYKKMESQRRQMGNEHDWLKILREGAKIFFKPLKIFSNAEKNNETIFI